MGQGLRCADVRAALPLSRNSDSQLILLVGSNPRSLKTRAEREAADLAWRTQRLNVELGTALAAYMPAERVDVAWELLIETVGSHPDGVVLIGTDLLWEPSLGYEPYRSLRRIGRSGPVLASWFGRVDGSNIIRAEPGHPEYTRDRLDVPYVPVD